MKQEIKEKESLETAKKKAQQVKDKTSKFYNKLYNKEPEDWTGDSDFLKSPPEFKKKVKFLYGKDDFRKSLLSDGM